MNNRIDSKLRKTTEKKKWSQKNISTLTSSSLLCPNMVNLSAAPELVRPSLLHLRFSKTSSMGMLSCTHKEYKIIKKTHRHTQKLHSTQFTDPLPNQLFPSAQLQELQAYLPSFSASNCL